MKFRKKPVVIEAVKWEGYTEGNLKAVADLIGPNFSWEPVKREISIHTLEGVMKAESGDWIIKGVKGECYPCKPDIFEAIYEKVDE